MAWHALLPAAAALQPDILVTLKDDVDDVGFPQGGIFTWDVYVLDSDKPFENLKLLGVDRLGPGWGTMRMDSTKTFFYYTVDTKEMREGMRFTDKFRCVQFDAVEPTGLTMRSLQH
jgi:hypothetical protein